ncbi:DUF4381 domain-containing protein [Desulfogranum marinum]|uniref:DUF4381 domain-containing protein n=1 Tax=Desulfogranum marinum TaxID=453220 RepID=UPI00196600C5|nr:DUF4381 domain-containing protein [Desulfogranum marinum]MBM9513620.1 DUF4381 domain-containing protein [Desulfogranum marinum]
MSTPASLQSLATSPPLPLKDYHLPPPVSWWPPAVGWWMLLLLGAVIVALLYLLYRHYRRQTWRRNAFKALEKIQNNYQQQPDNHVLAAQVSIFLRRICLTRFPGNNGSSLTGSEWLLFLDSCPGEKKSHLKLFHTPMGEQLLEAAYNPKAELDGTALLDVCRQWLVALPARPWRKNAAI